MHCCRLVPDAAGEQAKAELTADGTAPQGAGAQPGLDVQPVVGAEAGVGVEARLQFPMGLTEGAPGVLGDVETLNEGLSEKEAPEPQLGAEGEAEPWSTWGLFQTQL